VNKIEISGLEPYNGPWGAEQVKHFLKRTMFGAKPVDIQHFSNLPFQLAHSQLIRINKSFIAPPINTYSEKDTDVPFGKTWVNAPFNDGLKFDRLYTSIYWWINRQINQDRSITEKMILFWQNHFGVAVSGSLDPRNSYRYINTLHENALGNFKKMIKDITVDPLMLTFLNGFQNEARAPDENYARELMELFTIGKGPESKYTEDDVKSAAKVLTGFILDYNNGTADFHVNRHNITDKKFSAFFNNKIIKLYNESANENWTTEIFGLIDMIFEKEEVSKFICRKFYRFFVNYDITDEIETNIILPLAKIFRDNNYEILPVIQTLFGSKHFFDTDNVGSMIKSPIDFYIGMLREMEPDLPNNDILKYSYFMDLSRKTLSFLQQNLAEPPNVAGWPAYYQIPFYGRSWINSETLKSRGNLLDIYLDKDTKPRKADIFVDLVKYTDGVPNAENPDKLIEAILTRIISQKPTNEFKIYLKKILLSDQDSDYYWTEAWLNYKAKPTDSVLKGIVEVRLKQLFKTILHLNEYNLH
jgi:uncharacterized protein (DUF1800 family)